MLRKNGCDAITRLEDPSDEDNVGFVCVDVADDHCIVDQRFMNHSYRSIATSTSTGNDRHKPVSRCADETSVDEDEDEDQDDGTDENAWDALDQALLSVEADDDNDVVAVDVPLDDLVPMEDRDDEPDEQLPSHEVDLTPRDVDDGDGEAAVDFGLADALTVPRGATNEPEEEGDIAAFVGELDVLPLEEDDGDGLGEQVLLEASSRTLPERRSLRLEWQDSETARQLLPLSDGFVALGKECRRHAPGGEVVARCEAPPGMVSAVLFGAQPKASASRASNLALDFDLLCLVDGRLLHRIEDDWQALNLSVDDAVFPIRAVLNHETEVLVACRDRRWRRLRDHTLQEPQWQQQFSALAFAEGWFALVEDAGRLKLASLRDSEEPVLVDGESFDVGAQLLGAGQALCVVATSGMWLRLGNGPLRRVPGSEDFSGAHLGHSKGVAMVWTTVEQRGSFDVVEINVETGSPRVVARLPWTATDDDVPTVSDILWMDALSRLIVASDCGVVSLKPLEATSSGVPPGETLS